MADRITLDFSRFEARVHSIETRMLKMEAFLGMALAAVFDNAPIVATIEKELGPEKTRGLLVGVHGYVAELQSRGIDGRPQGD